MALSLSAAHQLPPPARKENGVETVLSGYVPLCSTFQQTSYDAPKQCWILLNLTVASLSQVETV
jgi:hypothetical protein